jgi:hypothetical protein
MLDLSITYRPPATTRVGADWGSRTAELRSY